ncbi:MAG TPA: DUF397 domain-containing protein [Streptosporangiaceae bacterium]|nr:DUF397 domain-containing protein [Streptosporangiaceae bacterium]
MNVDYSGARWRKSSRSGGQGGACVEVADLGDAIGVRDSKNPGGSKLAFSRREMADFAARVKTGHLDT